VLRLHPEDAGWLAQHEHALAELCKLSQLEGSLELRTDPTLTRGGCCIESNLGDLDARVETRLTLLAAALGLNMDSPSSEEA
jgi:flagellar biosynthesis/type III secretory pathway protein FliH